MTQLDIFLLSECSDETPKCSSWKNEYWFKSYCSGPSKDKQLPTPVKNEGVVGVKFGDVCKKSCQLCRKFWYK
jgi:hypothetical protein